MNKKIISSILSLTLCSSLVVGSTYALFTSESETNIAINSGKVKMVATLGNLQTFSAVAKEDKSDYDSVEQEKGKFLNEGTAAIEGNTITLDKMTPGDKATFDIVLTNESNVAIQYQTMIKSIEDSGLFSGLVITVEEATFTGTTVVSEWAGLAAHAQPEDNVISVSVELPVGAKNEYQETSTDLAVNVNAVQGNAIVDNPEEGFIYIYTKTELAAFAKSVNEGNTYEGYTVALGDDIDLNNTEWTPIGQKGKFSGVFDGQGYTISNLKINNSSASYCGLFGRVSKNPEKQDGAVIKNLIIENADVTGGHWTSIVAGNVHTGSVENVTVKGDIKVNGGAYVGAIVGYGYVDIRDCKVLANEGSFITSVSSYLGGISGFRGEGSYITENCVVENITLTGTSVVGGITARAHYGNTINNCRLTNVTIHYVMANQTNPQLKDPNCVGAIAGTYGAGETVKISNNTFTGTIITDSDLHNDNVIGSGSNNLVLENNTINATIIKQ